MDPDYTDQYERFELAHWWFVARRRIIHAAIDRYAGRALAHPRWLDVGCGSGVLLHSYPAITDKLGVEMDPGSVARARAKGLDVRQCAGAWDFRDLGSFDLITVTDVLEHIEHEPPAIDAVRAVLRDNGILLITVPALMSLWSSHDVVNRHFRRYTRSSLVRLFPSKQWKVLKATYFSSLLLTPIWLARKWKNLHGSASPEGHDFRFGPYDRLLQGIFNLEDPWLRMGNFPLGSSILLVLQKV